MKLIPFAVLILIRLFWVEIPQNIFYLAAIEFLILIQLFQRFQNSKWLLLLNARQIFTQRKYKKISLKLNLQLVSGLFKLISILFWGLWVNRWFEADFQLRSVWPQLIQLSILDGLLLTSGLSLLIETQRINHFFLKAKINSAKQVFIHFILALLSGGLLLVVPFSLNEGQSLSLVDAFFIAGSALSVTGLTPIDISQVLSFYGHIILLVLIQLGGLGVMVLTAGLSAVLYQRLSLKSIMAHQDAFGLKKLGEVSSFLPKVIAITFGIEIIGAFFIYIQLPHDLPNRFFSALFHSISSFCNAGFSLYSNNLYQSPFGTGSLIVICLLIILGGLGFPLMLELIERWNTETFKWRRLSPQTQISLIMTAGLLFLGSLVLFIFDSFHKTSNLDILTSLGQSLFYSISSRTAGFNLVPVEQFHISVQLMIILLMFVGANPSSTGGGVKTTTIGLLLATVKSTLFGQKQTIIAGRAVSFDNVRKALSIIVLYIFTAAMAIGVLTFTEKIEFIGLVFEVVSALSTVGLSLSVTSELTEFGKIIILFLMLFGRIGILTVVALGLDLQKSGYVQYPEEDFTVG